MAKKFPPRSRWFCPCPPRAGAWDPPRFDRQGEIVVPPGVLDLIDPDGPDRLQNSMPEAPLHHIFHGMADFLPGGLKRLGHFFPGQFSRPVCQKLHVGSGKSVLALGPRHLFHRHAAALTAHPSHAVEEKHQQAPERNELKAPFVEVVVAAAGLMTPRANCRRADPRPHPHLNAFLVGRPFRIVRRRIRESDSSGLLS